MIKSTLEDSYSEKKSHISELKTLITKMEEANVCSRKSEKLVQDLTGKNGELSKMLLGARSEIKDLEKENAEARKVIEALKQELQEMDRAVTTLLKQNKLADRRQKKLHSQGSNLIKILAEVKVEMLQLEKLSESFQNANDGLNRDLGERDKIIRSLSQEVENLKGREKDLSQNATALQKVQKKYQFLLAKERSTLAAMAELKTSAEEKDRVIQKLQDEVSKLKTSPTSAEQESEDRQKRNRRCSS